MIEISSRSWHLRLVRKVWAKTYKPVSLCSYFWTVVSALGLAVALVLLSPLWWPLNEIARKTPPTWLRKTAAVVGLGISALALISILGLVIFEIVLVILHWAEVWAWLAQNWWKLVLSVGAVVVGVLVAIIAIEVRIAERPRKPKLPKEPNLLVEWVKAKKRRVCPLIVVKEATNDAKTVG